MKNKTVALLLLLMLIIFSVTLASGDDDGEEGTQNEIMIENLSDSNLVILDSIYTLINSNYQTIKPILEKSCFDCHTTKTDYPWYHSLPIIGGMIDDHVKDGLEHLDMTDDFPFKSKENLEEILEEMKEEIEENDMPLLSYRFLHWGTAIENETQDSVFLWIDNSLGMIEKFYQTVDMPHEADADPKGEHIN